MLFFCSPDSPLGALGPRPWEQEQRITSVIAQPGHVLRGCPDWAGWMHQKWKCHGMSTKKVLFLGLFNLFNRNSAALNPATCENQVSKKSQEIMSASTKKRACVKYPPAIFIFYGASKLIHAGFLAVTSLLNLPWWSDGVSPSDPRCSILQKLNISIISSMAETPLMV